MSEVFSAQLPKATWNTVNGVWETSQVNLLCGHSALWQVVWPISGTTVNGQVFELPTQEHPTTVSESSLLRSPKASEGQGGALGEAEARKRGNTVGVRDQVMDLVASQGHKVSRAEVNDLLPTPIVRDYKDGQQEVLRDGKVQTDTVGRAIMNSGEVLLGTPRTSNANGATQKQIDLGAPKKRLEDQVHTEWGKFQPAIERWEATLGRPAPAPTKPDGKDGAHRLSSAFTEWMMGLPEGWVTDVGLSRTDELKACGNGVVPQQAELALRILLEGINLSTGKAGMPMFPTPTPSDIFTDSMKSSQQKEGSMHSVTLSQAVKMISNTEGVENE